MRKVYLFIMSLCAGSTVYAQQVYPPTSNRGIQNLELLEKPAQHTNTLRSGGNPIWIQDFNGAIPAGWTATTNTGNVPWVWTNVGHTGAYPSAALASTTAANGWMIIDSDLNGATGTPEDADLVSEQVDLTGYPNVQLQFEQHMREWQNDITTVSVSGDDGFSWTDFQINDNVGQTGTANPDLVSINVSAIVGNSNQARIKFNWQGEWDYGWQIDDVCFVVASPHNITLNQASYYHDSPSIFGPNIAYTMIPSGQIHAIRFEGEIFNNGMMTENAWLDLSVTDGGNNIVYTGSGTSVPVSTNMSVIDSTTTTFTPPTTPDTYTASYYANYDSVAFDADTADNYGSAMFEVTSCRYGRDNNNYTGAGLWNGAGNPYVLGNVFQVEAAQQLTHIEVVLTGNTAVGAIIYPQLYEIDPATGDFNLILDASGTLCEHIVTAADIAVIGPNPSALCLCFSQPYTVQPGVSYIATIGHYGGPDDVVVANGGTSPDQTSFLLDGTSNTWFYTNSTPMIRMLFDNCVCNIVGGIDPEDIQNLTLGQNIPNPATSSTTINYSLLESVDVTLEIVDITGKIITSIDRGIPSAGEHQIEVNTTKFAAGIYYYTLHAGAEKMTQKMVIAR
jgi:hypothetical protein